MTISFITTYLQFFIMIGDMGKDEKTAKMVLDEFVIFRRFCDEIQINVTGMICDIIDYIPQPKILKIGDTVEINGREVPYLYQTQKVPSNYIPSDYVGCYDEELLNRDSTTKTTTVE